MKKSTAILWITVMALIAAVFCVLFISGTIRNEEQIEALKGDTVDKAARIMKLDADNTEKNNTIGDLYAETEDLEAEITALEDQLKQHMTEQGIDSFTAGAFKVTWKEVTSNRLDTTAMKKAFPAETLAPYMKTTVTKRFNVA